MSDMSLGQALKTATDAASGMTIASATQIISTTKYGDPAYHDAHGFLFKHLERGLREWVRENPSGNTKDTPMRAVWLYRDTLEGPGVVISAIDNILTRDSFPKLVTRTLQSISGTGRSKDKDRVAAAHPQYRQLLQEIAEAKRVWKADDARIKGTHAFRMMGGLARMGTRDSTRYHGLVKDAQRMEKSVLGKTLTKATGV